MVELSVQKKDIDTLLYPFRYNGAIIFADNVLNQKGFYGYKNNSLFFISIENLEDEITIEIPDSFEEALQLMEFINYIVVRLQGMQTFNLKEEKSGEAILGTSLEFIKPFIDFIKNQEKIFNMINCLKSS